ncbi:hypothetical protein [Candidatus Synchoanobacter obligatus]|uniref:DUF4395 domain-containing protein n=1 Tax=Candidatus Synchoanobacter obligatus TaxID=2919597 RepID=A0ABT1L459_9GAMM|nr:hypothetical protein [Candidatus Synchoanobacter obligatus]MCP8351953.1 hypothetical protein [Candidatus Synchoanobacter obligatus]
MSKYRLKRLLTNIKNAFVPDQHRRLKNFLIGITAISCALGMVIPTYASLMIMSAFYNIALFAIFKFAHAYQNEEDFSETFTFGLLALSIPALKLALELTSPAFLPMLMMASAWVSLKISLALVDNNVVEPVKACFNGIIDGSLDKSRAENSLRSIACASNLVKIDDIFTWGM